MKNIFATLNQKPLLMNPKLYKCFIASPSDTSKEREICDIVFNEINKTIGDTYNFRIESLKWENDVRPTLKGSDAQTIINEQVKDKYDIFIGLMFKKFGTPTKNAGSGTEEEFNIAYKRHIDQEDIEVIFYFNDEPPQRMSEIDPLELLKVNEFKTKVGNLGIYGTYNSIIDFETKLKRHLSAFFSEKHNQLNSSIANSDIQIDDKEVLSKIFHERLNNSLLGFNSQPLIWVEPVLCKSNEIVKNADENYNNRLPLEELIHNPSSYIIKAPPQFGLTSLAHRLVKDAWEYGDLWIYIDSEATKPHTIHNAVKNEVAALRQQIQDVKCIVLDSWRSTEIASLKKLKNLVEANNDIPIIVMQTIEDHKFLDDEDEQIAIKREFDILHLLALPRGHIRQFITQYNKDKHIADDNTILEKVISDLECLNIHRTPYNCLTLLKVSEKHFDESPINRTKMIEMVLLVLFDLGEIPTYKIKPDVKDCEYALGRFCELLIKDEKYTFSKDYFLKELERFCSEKLIQLDNQVVFEVLFINNIITLKNDSYCFRSTFWIFYFAAKRMYSDKGFRVYIFDKKIYATCPEIIEFYTGIDRQRDDALTILLDDIKCTCDSVHEKIGIDGEINPLGLAKWKPTEENINKIQEEISQDVLTSKLPNLVKDKYLDKNYNQIKPYNQGIQKLFEEYSLYSLMQKIIASSRALRNSDYAEPELKKKLLKEIYRSWGQLSQILFVLAPIMASEGHATFEGANFTLSGKFGENPEERLKKIILVNPTNVVGFYKDDLFSAKLAPLLYDNFSNEKNSLSKHLQALLLIFKRPLGWKSEIEKYIVSLNKNSFFLYDTVIALRIKYKFDFVDASTLKDIEYLVKKGLAKHEFGDTNPGLDKILKISNNRLPKRESEETM